MKKIEIYDFGASGEYCPVDIDSILKCINDAAGEKCNWYLVDWDVTSFTQMFIDRSPADIYMEIFGFYGDVLGKVIDESQHGILLTWSKLNALGTCFHGKSQIAFLGIYGIPKSISPGQLVKNTPSSRYINFAKLCDYSLEVIDSELWSIYARDQDYACFINTFRKTRIVEVENWVDI
ncbi:MAG: hypothetical protein OEY93_11160 [Anaerolineae bacterium]|nr:hypothetical protein [Anaerolineae bacterium]